MTEKYIDYLLNLLYRIAQPIYDTRCHNSRENSASVIAERADSCAFGNA